MCSDACLKLRLVLAAETLSRVRALDRPDGAGLRVLPVEFLFFRRNEPARTEKQNSQLKIRLF